MNEIINSLILFHNVSGSFANIIESSHTVVSFLLIGVSVVSMSVAGFQVILKLNKPNEAFRFGVFIVSQIAHIFFLTWPGQQLIDHSEQIHGLVYETVWYDRSPRSEKLVILMMMRSFEPCKLTAGKLYEVSFVTLSLIIKTSMSYFTILNSFG